MSKRTRKTPRQIWDTFSLKDKRQCAANDYRCLRIGIYGGNMDGHKIWYSCGCVE